MPRFRLTVTHEYNANPDSYPGCETTKDMADLDLTNFRDNPELLLDYLNDAMSFTVNVEPI